jgi:LCP family protein required for cell wall assembly
MLLGLRVLTAILSVVVLVVAAYTWATFRIFSSNVTYVNAIAKPVAASGTASGSASAAPAADVDGKDQNVLLVGDDHRPDGASAAELAQLSTGYDDGGTNTDTMIVLHIPADGSRASMISFPRDSWVSIPGHGMNKLNAAFEYGSQNGGGDTGGARLLISVIQNMTGLTIDHFVRVSLLGFYDIAKVLGPIKVCLNQAAKDSYSGTNLPKGVSMLDAKQALSFVRQRHNLPRGDLDREVRQQYFLSAAFRQVQSAGTLLNPFKLNSLLSAVSSSLETDLQGTGLLTFAEQFSNLSAGNLSSTTIPITGTPTITYNGSDVSIVAVDTAAMPGFIARVIGPSTAYTKAKAAAPGPVNVINATGKNGTGTTTTAALTALGFQATTDQSDHATSTITYIQYPAGMEAQAKALAAAIPGAAIAVTSTVPGVTLVLGSDGVTVTAAAVGVTPGAPTPTPTVTPTSPAVTYTDASCIN